MFNNGVFVRMHCCNPRRGKLRNMQKTDVEVLPPGNDVNHFHQLEPPRNQIDLQLPQVAKGWYRLLWKFLGISTRIFPPFFRIRVNLFAATMASWGGGGFDPKSYAVFQHLVTSLTPPKVAPIFWRNFGSLDFEIHPIFCSSFTQFGKERWSNLEDIMVKNGLDHRKLTFWS